MHTGTVRPVLVDLYAAHTATGIRPGTLRVWRPSTVRPAWDDGHMKPRRLR